jgi:hypothetical protein
MIAGHVCAGNLSAQEAPALDIVLNELAWMGTLTSANDEWIELHNTTGSAIDLAGWTLFAADGTPHIEQFRPAGTSLWSGRMMEAYRVSQPT